jgi:hypothetical protein
LPMFTRGCMLFEKCPYPEHLPAVSPDVIPGQHTRLGQSEHGLTRYVLKHEVHGAVGVVCGHPIYVQQLDDVGSSLEEPQDRVLSARDAACVCAGAGYIRHTMHMWADVPRSLHNP